MARQKQRSQLTAISDINMTPLIDLTFLLLIIFMITMPLLEYGVNVNPPEMNADPLPDDNSKIINLDADGNVVFNKTSFQLDELRSRLEKELKINPKLLIMIRADGTRPYKEVMNVMKSVKEAGIQEVSLVTQAEENN
jgi:biopolymer transport protein ExbD